MQKDRTTNETDRIVVYTCVTGNYDSLTPVKAGESGVDFVCFSDRTIVSPGWQSVSLQSPCRLCTGHDINRFHKLFPHRIFKQHRFSVYVDANIRYKGSFRELVQKLHSSGAALAAFSHPDGRSIEEEVKACEQLGKFCRDDYRKRDSQIEAYRGEGFDISREITANYLLVRDHYSVGLATAMSLWWSSLFEFTKRDQLSLNEVLWKTGLPWKLLDSDLGVDADLLMRVPHTQPLMRTIALAAKRKLKRRKARSPMQKSG